MTMTRDFLDHHAPAESESPAISLVDMLREQNDLLRKMVMGLGRLTPTVRTETVVHNAGVNATYGVPNYISDNNPHKITFEIGGKPVMVHRLMVWAYDTAANVHLQLEPSQGWGAGFNAFQDLNNVVAFPSIYDISVSEIYVRGSDGAGSNPYFINQENAGIGLSTIFIYGWTTDDWEYGFSAARKEY